MRRMLAWRPQLMHNANLIFATTELLFNAMPLRPSQQRALILLAARPP